MSFYGWENLPLLRQLLEMAPDPGFIVLILDIALTIIVIIIVFLIYRKVKKRKQAEKQAQQQPAQQIQQAPRSQAYIDQAQSQQQALQEEMNQGFKPRQIRKWGDPQTPIIQTADQIADNQLEDGIQIKPIGDDFQVKPKLPPVNFDLSNQQVFWKEKEPQLWLIIGITALALFFFIR